MTIYGNDFINSKNVETPIEQLWCSFCDYLLITLDKFVPSKLVRNNRKQPWITRSIRQLSRRKQRCYNKAKITKSASLWQNYKFLKQSMQRECRRAYNSYMYRMIHKPYENGKKKKFFRYVKSLRVDRCGVPVLIKDGIKHTTNQAKANVLNQHFSSVFTHDGETHYQTWVLAHIQVCQILI